MKSKLSTELQLLSRTARAESTGIIAVFCGDCRVDKTLAAEALADDLNMKLVRIDLSRVASKFIGETEKNLRNLFDTAETNGAILLFDEADALFGKRTGIKDSHDHYANIEVSYLLQFLEENRGLAILSTHLKSSLDRSVLKQVSHILDFPRCRSPKCD